MHMHNRFIFLSVLVGCVSVGGTHSGSQTAGAAAPSLLVSVKNAVCDHRGKPEFDWTITNPNEVPAFVYSTFLKGRSASSEFDRASKVYTIWTTQPKELDFAVNYYPSATFAVLKPGGILKGRFVESPGKPDYCVGCGKAPKGAAWIALAVAFGSATE